MGAFPAMKIYFNTNNGKGAEKLFSYRNDGKGAEKLFSYRNDGKGAGPFSVRLRLFLTSMILFDMRHSTCSGGAQAVEYVGLSYRMCSRIRCHQFINSLTKQRSPFRFVGVVSVFSTLFVFQCTGLTGCLPCIVRVTYTSPEILCAAACEWIRQCTGGKLRRSTVKGL
jgi:hypothetical protein